MGGGLIALLRLFVLQLGGRYTDVCYINFFSMYLFTYLAARVLVATHGIVHLRCRTWGIFSCSTRDLVSRPGMEPGPPALGVWSVSHWTTRELPTFP